MSECSAPPPEPPYRAPTRLEQVEVLCHEAKRELHKCDRLQRVRSSQWKALATLEEAVMLLAAELREQRETLL
jgi:hypothetical protein